MIALVLLAALAVQDDPAKALDALIPKLASENLEERAAAAGQLARLCGTDPKGLREALRRRIATSTDEEVKAHLTTTLAQMPPLALTFVVEGEAKAGYPVLFKTRITNLSGADVTVVGALDGSEMGIRYPHFTVAIVDGAGKAFPWNPRAGRFHTNDIEERHFKTLKAGEEFDPFGPAFTDLAVLKSWLPAAGRYTVTLKCDYTAKGVMAWHRQNGLHRMEYPELSALLDKVPKVTLEAKVVVEVR